MHKKLQNGLRFSFVSYGLMDAALLGSFVLNFDKFLWKGSLTRI